MAADSFALEQSTIDRGITSVPFKVSASLYDPVVHQGQHQPRRAFRRRADHSLLSHVTLRSSQGLQLDGIHTSKDRRYLNIILPRHPPHAAHQNSPPQVRRAGSTPQRLSPRCLPSRRRPRAAVPSRAIISDAYPGAPESLQDYRSKVYPRNRPPAPPLRRLRRAVREQLASAVQRQQTQVQRQVSHSSAHHTN